MNNKANIFWCIVWGVILALAIVAIFWERIIIVTAIIAACFFGAFLHDAIKYRNK